MMNFGGRTNACVVVPRVWELSTFKRRLTRPPQTKKGERKHCTTGIYLWWWWRLLIFLLSNRPRHFLVLLFLALFLAAAQALLFRAAGVGYYFFLLNFIFRPYLHLQHPRHFLAVTATPLPSARWHIFLGSNQARSRAHTQGRRMRQDQADG